jgi:prolyl 4-hydroxylase
MTATISNGTGPDAGAHLIGRPGVQRVPNPKLSLYISKNFADPQECAAIIERVDAGRRPSTIADSNGDPLYRTSETCDLDRADPVVAALELRIAAFLGIDPHYGEPLQGQRYAVGQEFKQHTDYFEPKGTDYDEHCTISGQRTWTAMLYLNEPDAGGATRFLTVGKLIQPETGKLICWNNQRPGGTPNPATLHHGMKVRAGTKYVVTKWFRERPWPA